MWFKSVEKCNSNLEKIAKKYSESNSLCDAISFVFPDISEEELSSYLVRNADTIIKLSSDFSFKDDGTKDMLLHNLDVIADHIEVIKKSLKDDKEISPWMIDKIATSRTDLNDIKMHFERS